MLASMVFIPVPADPIFGPSTGLQAEETNFALNTWLRPPLSNRQEPPLGHPAALA